MRLHISDHLGNNARQRNIGISLRPTDFSGRMLQGPFIRAALSSLAAGGLSIKVGELIVGPTVQVVEVCDI